MRVPLRGVLGLSAGALCLLLAGCGGGTGAVATSHTAAIASAGASITPWAQLHPLTNPAAYIGPSTARITQTDIEPITAQAAPQLPATVTDIQNTSVTVRSVDRILALDIYGSLSATVYGLGLGDHLVGRDQSTGFPAAAALPVVTGGAHQLNAEAILRLHPTVLITDTTLGPWDVVLQIRAAGVPVVVVDSKRSLASVGTLVDQVSSALGVRSEGDALRSRLTTEIAAEQKQIDQVMPAKPLRMVFLYVRGQAGVYYIFGKGSGADSLIDALGGEDVATEAGIGGLSPLDAEALAKVKPDVILMMTGGLESVGGIEGALKMPGLAQTPAGQHRRIVDMSDYEMLSFGPLSADVLDALARAIYAPDADR
jgi:iron complex transport system substrate-binding protein